MREKKERILKTWENFRESVAAKFYSLYRQHLVNRAHQTMIISWPSSTAFGMGAVPVVPLIGLIGRRLLPNFPPRRSLTPVFPKRSLTVLFIAPLKWLPRVAVLVLFDVADLLKFIWPCKPFLVLLDAPALFGDLRTRNIGSDCFRRSEQLRKLKCKYFMIDIS